MSSCISSVPDDGAHASSVPLAKPWRIKHELKGDKTASSRSFCVSIAAMPMLTKVFALVLLAAGASSAELFSYGLKTGMRAHNNQRLRHERRSLPAFFRRRRFARIGFWYRVCESPHRFPRSDDLRMTGPVHSVLCERFFQQRA